MKRSCVALWRELPNELIWCLALISLGTAITFPQLTAAGAAVRQPLAQQSRLVAAPNWAIRRALP